MSRKRETLGKALQRLDKIRTQRDELVKAIEAVLALPNPDSGRIYKSPTLEQRMEMRLAYMALHEAIAVCK